ncbi:element excision factor XisI family protein [Spirosoma soli]|uniref:Element excision factor XisI family protein n=1 Tax=Spirosoma soli TaxID=1770529 RepID=A0ABW5M9N0_9BACT
MHFDIINGKVWLQVNNTDRELTDELIDLNVRQEDIVLAFHPENLRKHTGFAVS